MNAPIRTRAVPLGELVSLVMGQAPPGHACNKTGEGTVFVKAGEFDDRFPLVREWTTKPLKMARKGDVLVCVVGATAGKVNDSIDCAIGRSVAAVRPNPDALHHGYLYRYLQSKTLVLRDEAQGLAQGVITREMLNRIEIPLPPLAEQKRIAAILDQADALRRLRRRALDRLNALGQAIFQEMFGDPVSGACGLPRACIGDLIEGFETGKNIAEDPDANGEARFRILKVSAVTSGFFRPEEAKPLPASYDPPASHIVRDGDLLFSRANTEELIGATAFVREKFDKLVLPDKTWRFVWRKNSPVLSDFVKFLFDSAGFRDQIRRRSTGTSGSMKNISQAKVLSIGVGLPPMDRQEEFSDRLGHAWISRERSEASRLRMEALFSSLQHRAFTGPL